MCKFKVGDTIKLEKVDDIDLRKGFKKGDIYSVIRIDTVNKETRIFIKGQDFVYDNQIISFDYKTSNRYKLKQAIKETGISSRKLSHFAVGNESFFYNQTGPARFKEYGDISSSKLDSMLVLIEIAKINLNAKITQDAFDEREKLDLTAKTVDENNVPFVDLKDLISLSTNIPKSKLFGSSSESDCGNSDIEDYYRYINESTGIVEAGKKLESYVEQLQSQEIEKRDYRLRKWLIAFLILVIILAVYFFNH